MGCCLVAAVLIGAPRIGLFITWLAQPGRFTVAFGSAWLWPLLGFLILPWTTLAYVFVAPGGLNLFKWIILAIALLIDLAAHGGGGRAYRDRRS
jgi:hypothetical protein